MQICEKIHSQNKRDPVGKILTVVTVIPRVTVVKEVKILTFVKEDILIFRIF